MGSGDPELALEALDGPREVVQPQIRNTLKQIDLGEFGGGLSHTLQEHDGLIEFQLSLIKNAQLLNSLEIVRCDGQNLSVKALGLDIMSLLFSVVRLLQQTSQISLCRGSRQSVPVQSGDRNK